MTPRALLVLALHECAHERVHEELQMLLDSDDCHHMDGRGASVVTLGDIVGAVVRGGGWTVEAARGWLLLAVMGVDDAPGD